jgi:prepilin-type N-terminal cleavage/methylation domain-containing protein
MSKKTLFRRADKEQCCQSASKCVVKGICRDPGPRTPDPVKPSHDGFTLIELSVVLFLMALIVSLSSLFFGNTLPSAKLNATGRELSATIRQARSRAQLNGISQAVLLNLDMRRYGIEGQTSRSIPPEIGMRVIDPLLGEVQSGTYRILFEATGGVEGAAIDLWNSKKMLRIATDPILGTVTLKQ